MALFDRLFDTHRSWWTIRSIVAALAALFLLALVAASVCGGLFFRIPEKDARVLASWTSIAVRLAPRWVIFRAMCEEARSTNCNFPEFLSRCGPSMPGYYGDRIRTLRAAEHLLDKDGPVLVLTGASENGQGSVEIKIKRDNFFWIYIRTPGGTVRQSDFSMLLSTMSDKQKASLADDIREDCKF